MPAGSSSTGAPERSTLRSDRLCLGRRRLPARQDEHVATVALGIAATRAAVGLEVLPQGPWRRPARSAGRERPQIELTRGYHGSCTHTEVTVKSLVRAGSAVAVKPDITHAWAPRQTTRPTGLPVLRIMRAALRERVLA